jgi:hypothetical protein
LNLLSGQLRKLEPAQLAEATTPQTIADYFGGLLGCCPTGIGAMPGHCPSPPGNISSTAKPTPRTIAALAGGASEAAMTIPIDDETYGDKTSRDLATVRQGNPGRRQSDLGDQNDAAAVKDPRDTDHAAGEEHAKENTENESPG